MHGRLLYFPLLGLLLFLGFSSPLQAEAQSSRSRCSRAWGSAQAFVPTQVKKIKAKHAEFTRLPMLAEPAFDQLQILQERELSNYFKDVELAPVGISKGKPSGRIKSLELNADELAVFNRDLDDFLTLCQRVNPGRFGKNCGYEKEIFLKWWEQNKGLILNRRSIEEMKGHTLGTLIAIHYPEAVKKAFLEKRDLPLALKLLMSPFHNHYTRAALRGVGKPVYAVVASFLATAFFTAKFTPTQVVFSGLANPYLGPLSDKSGQVGQSVSGGWAIHFKKWLMNANSSAHTLEAQNFAEAIAGLSEETRRLYQFEGMSSEQAWKSLNELRGKWIAMGQKFAEIFPGYEQSGRGIWMEQVHQFPGQYSVNMASFDHFQKDYDESETKLTDQITSKFKVGRGDISAFVDFYDAERKAAGGDLPSEINGLRARKPALTERLLAPLLKKQVPIAMIGQLLRFREGKLVNQDAAGEMMATWMLRYFTFAESDRILKNEKAEVEDVRKRLGYNFYRRKFLDQFLEALQNEQVVMDQLAGAATFYADQKKAAHPAVKR